MGKRKNSDSKKKLNEKKKDSTHIVLWFTQPSAYTGRNNVYRAARCVLPSITKTDVDKWFEGQLSYTIHKPTRIHFTPNNTIVKSIANQLQAALCDMQSKASHNDGKTFILTCIDCFSKYAWAVSLENKTELMKSSKH